MPPRGRDDEPKDPDSWGGTDFIAREVNSQIVAMPDRPAVVIAVINWRPEFDEEIVRAFAEAYLSTTPLKAFGQIPFRVHYFGFDTSDNVSAIDLVVALCSIEDAEAIFYLDGVPVRRMTKLKVAPFKNAR